MSETSPYRCPWCGGECRYFGLETCSFRPRQIPRDEIKMVTGPCPRCLRRGMRINGCSHQLPNALGYILASFEIAEGRVTEIP